MMRHPRSGFSLLEVLIALAIFAMVVVPLLNLEMSCAAETGQVRLQRRAHVVAMQSLDRLLALRTQGDTNEKVGEFTVQTHTSDVRQVVGLQRLTVQIYYQEVGQNAPTKLEEMSAYRAR